VSQLSDVNAFIIESRQARSAEDLRALLGPFVREIGFHGFSLVQHVKHFSRSNKRFLALTDLSEGWVDYFLEHQLQAHDPVYAAARWASAGFRFGDVGRMVRIGGRQKMVETARAKAGISDGFCVPLHIPGEEYGSCSLVMTGGAPLPEKNLPLAQLASAFAYEAARRLLRNGVRFVRSGDDPEHQRKSVAGDRPRLTTRQLDCIILVARGKTDWEIARILGIHEQTVTQHLNGARRRLGVSRRSELAIHALYYGYVSFADVMH
jgi:LuxR family quorum-sensing system transcriptional regulator CciR